jgi:hypothetical protein
MDTTPASCERKVEEGAPSSLPTDSGILKDGRFNGIKRKITMRNRTPNLNSDLHGRSHDEFLFPPGIFSISLTWLSKPLQCHAGLTENILIRISKNRATEGTPYRI